MNVNRAIRKAVDTGKVVLGERETISAVISKKAKLVVVAENCPESFREKLTTLSNHSNLPVYEFEGTSISLGSVCKKPFLVSMLGVIEAGNSDVLELAKKRS